MAGRAEPISLPQAVWLVPHAMAGHAHCNLYNIATYTSSYTAKQHPQEACHISCKQHTAPYARSTLPYTNNIHGATRGSMYHKHDGCLEEALGTSKNVNSIIYHQVSSSGRDKSMKCSCVCLGAPAAQHSAPAASQAGCTAPCKGTAPTARCMV